MPLVEKAKAGTQRGTSLSSPADLTVIVPAYNEERTIGKTLASLLGQTLPAKQIIVVDDCSADRTAEVSRDFGARVVAPPQNTGSKAGAQNFGLKFVSTTFTTTVDADTSLAPDAIEKLLGSLRRTSASAASGFVLPRYVRTLWERGRYIEYLLAFSWYKPIQDYYRKPLISSGCFSIYGTEALRANGGWSTDTLAEDMDLTWTFYERGLRVSFAPDAICYPVEPETYPLMAKQLRRWSHGFIQNVILHRHRMLAVPFLRTFVAVALWDAIVASLFFLVVLPLISVLARQPLFLLGYVIDLPAVLVPVLWTARRRGEVRRALFSLPAFFVLRSVNALFMLEAVVGELLLGRRFALYEKGH